MLVFGSADSKRVTGAFFGSADSKGFIVGAAFGGRMSDEPRRVTSVRINTCDNTREDGILVTLCQGPIRDESVRT